MTAAGRCGYLMAMSFALRLPVLSSPTTSLRREDVPAQDWSDWRWQLKHRLTSLEELSPYLDLSEDERADHP